MSGAMVVSKDLTLFFREHLENMPGQMLINFSVSRNGLGGLGGRVVIPIMIAAMANKNAAKLLDLPDQIAMFHASSSSA